MFRRFLFKRVERWINCLAPEYRTKGYIQSSLGLLKILGMPTDFSRIIKSDRAAQAGFIGGAERDIASAEIRLGDHECRDAELTQLQEFLV